MKILRTGEYAPPIILGMGIVLAWITTRTKECQFLVITIRITTLLMEISILGCKVPIILILDNFKSCVQ
jgi:hypothetical protein